MAELAVNCARSGQPSALKTLGGIELTSKRESNRVAAFLPPHRKESAPEAADECVNYLCLFARNWIFAGGSCTLHFRLATGSGRSGPSQHGMKHSTDLNEVECNELDAIRLKRHLI